MLGQESTSGSALGSVDSETITRYTADRCGFYHAPERAPVRVGLWVGRAGPRQWPRKTGTEIQGCLIVHSQNKGLPLGTWIGVPPAGFLGEQDCLWTVDIQGQSQVTVTGLLKDLKSNPGQQACL